jgi:hypothetical protein
MKGRARMRRDDAARWFMEDPARVPEEFADADPRPPASQGNYFLKRSFSSLSPFGVAPRAICLIQVENPSASLWRRRIFDLKGSLYLATSSWRPDGPAYTCNCPIVL